MIMGLAALLGAGAGVGARLLTDAPQPVDGSERDPGEIKSETAATQGGEDAPPVSKTDLVGKQGAGKKKTRNAGGHGAGDGKNEAQAYYKFSRQFVVPIVVDGQPQAMMILDVVIAMSREPDGGAYSDEPRLRDAVLRALLAQAGAGELQGMLSEPQQLERTRAAILAQVRSVIGENAQSALLMDVAYQPF